jgi:hypothetical protein
MLRSIAARSECGCFHNSAALRCVSKHEGLAPLARPSSSFETRARAFVLCATAAVRALLRMRTAELAARRRAVFGNSQLGRAHNAARASRRSTVAVLGLGALPSPSAPAVLQRRAVAFRIRAASSSQPGRSAWRAGSRASRGERLRAAAAGRHASLRLQDRLRRRPSMSEAERLIHRLQYVVKH